MKKSWRNSACLAIAALAMVFAFATCTTDTDSPETNTEQGCEATHEWDNGKVTKAATENDDGEKTFACTKCGETKTEIIPALGHKHTIASEWTSDEALHWHEASCGKEEHRADKAAHEWNEGEITKVATENDDGEKTFTCITCGTTKTEAIPALNHVHTIASEWTSDEALHWHEASCGKEEHRADKAAHEWDNGEVTTEPTCIAEGETTYTCTVCGKTRSEPIAATGHEWNDGETTKAATENYDGEKTFTCITCGTTRTESIPALNHEHTIASEWTSDEVLHWHEASCGRYEHRTDVTEHIWDAGVVTTKPMCIEEGYRTYTCTVCNEKRNEPIAATGHSFSTTWKSDESGHWNECTSCGERKNFAVHATMTVTLTIDGERRNGTCSTCGYNNTSAWTKDTLSELSAALDNHYAKLNAIAKVKIVGELSDESITTISDVVKQSDRSIITEYVQYITTIYLDLSGTTGLEITQEMFKDCANLAEIIFPNSLTTIEDSAFYGCTRLRRIMLSNDLTTIENSAFWGCTDLISIEFPNSLTTIGDSAFHGCTSLANLEFPNSLTTIGDSAFYGCTSLESMTSPNNSLTTIGNRAFYNCANLESVVLPNGLTTIGDSAFCSCESLTSVTIPNGVTTINASAFNACHSLESVTLPEGLTTIGDGAFGGAGFTSITIPKSVTKIDRSAFSWCKKLEKVENMEGVTIIGIDAFGCCTSLKTIRIPPSVTEIDVKAFAYAGLETIELCEGLKKIGYQAFYMCSALSNIKIPSSVIHIREEAFGYCNLNRMEFKAPSGWKYRPSPFITSYDIDVSNPASNAKNFSTDEGIYVYVELRKE